MNSPKFIAVATVLTAWGFASPASAHAFGQRYDLPLPLWMFASAGAAAVLLSFVVIALFLKHDRAPGDYPTYNLLNSRLGRLLAHPVTLGVVRVFFFGLFLLTLATGFFGDPAPEKNLSVVMFWVIAWVGLAFVSSLLGNFWALINPWNSAFMLVEYVARRRDSSRNVACDLPYPESLGTWPAFVFFFAFAWMEITWTGSAKPQNVADILMVYSVITWLGMYFYGREVWLKHGEAFSVVYALFAKFAVTEVRTRDEAAASRISVYDLNDLNLGCINGYGAFFKAPTDKREWNLRPPGVGLRAGEAPSITLMFFVLLLLATVTYDGYTETEHFQSIRLAFFNQLQSLGQAADGIVDTVAFASFPLLFITVYLVFMAFVAAFAGGFNRFAVIAPLLVLSIVPISIAYHLSHYLSLLVFEGQVAIHRISDPFGFGWDLFGTADYKVDLTVIDAKFVWFFSVIAIVIGHIVAVYLSHAEALRIYRDGRRALISQIPMLILMMGYTVISLWIIAQPIVG